MRFLYYIGLLAILVFPFFSRAVSADLSIAITKFEAITSVGGDNGSDQKMLNFAWDLKSSIPRKLSLSLEIINTDTNIKRSIINPCLKLGSDNECLLEHPENYMNVDPISQSFWQ